VISQSNTDVLVIPEKATLNLDRIVLAYDTSAASKKALNRATDLSVAYGSELTIVTAFEVPLEGFAYSPGIWEKESQEAKLLLESAAELARQGGVRRVKTEIRHGKASGEICNLARTIDAGLIVVGCKPIHAMRKFLLGNVVENVVRNETNAIWIAKN
jgi:nucleotide-binding universal stress UspA family protein